MAAQANRGRRILKELKDIEADTSSKIRARPAGDDSDVTHLKGIFDGPPGTPYEGGQYVVDIKIPMEYPFKAPNMSFDTKIWHPNISSQTGAICIDTLSTAWSPVLTIKSVLLSLQSLLQTPEPKDPQDAEVAQMLMKNPREFARKAADWAVKYAGAPVRESLEKSEEFEGQGRESEAERKASYRGYNEQVIDNFINMGFDKGAVVNAFASAGVYPSGERYIPLDNNTAASITARLLGEQE